MMNQSLRCVLLLGVVLLNACTAVHTAVSKRNLDVQTRLTQTIHLDPVEPELRTVFVDIRNTTDRAEFDVHNSVLQTLQKRGYQITDNPDKATYWLQVNVRSISKLHPQEVLTEGRDAMSYEEVQRFLHPERELSDKQSVPWTPRDDDDERHSHIHFGGHYHVGRSVDSDDLKKVLLAAVVIVAAEGIGNALVDDVYYTMITDIQIAERQGELRVTESAEHRLVQGDSGETHSVWDRISDRRKYQTRVVSFANKVNLNLDEAQDELKEGLTRTLSGIF